jgi:CHAT domain-containing protein/tetratricopeptide (TPR) repeat protein
MIQNLRLNSARSMLFALFLAASSVFAHAPAGQNLLLNQPLEREIKGGETHSYILQIGANQTAHVEIEQRGVDVALAAYKPGGAKYIDTDSPAGFTGSDSILVTAAEAGEYRVAVEPSDPKADAGRYVIRLAEIRPTVAEDFRINEAALKIRQLAEKAESLRGRGTREERRQAADAYAQILELSRIKKDKIWAVVALVEGGDVLRQLGELQMSVELTERGLSLAREVGNREHEGSALNNLGVEYKELGDYEKGILYLTQALDIQRETNDKRGEAIVLNNLGSCYLLGGDLTKAEELYLQSIVLRRLVKDRRGEANTLNNLGQVYDRHENNAKAVEFLEQALKLRRELGDKTGEAITLRNLAKSYSALGEKEKAVEYYAGANALAKRLGDRRVEADSAYGLAIAERERGNLDKAIETVEGGLALIEQTRNELVNPELRVTYFASVLRYYELYTELLAGRYARSKEERDLALALETSERARARGLVELLREARVNIKQGIDPKLIEQAQELQEKLNLQYRRRTAALAGNAKPETLAKLTSDINSLTTELETVQVKIRRDNPRYADLTQGATLSAKEIQSLLDDQTVLLEYKLGAARSFLWLVTSDSIKMFTLPPRAEVEKAARDFYDSTATRGKAQAAKADEFSDKLSRMLLAPVTSAIENKRLAVVADGVLQFVPFAALRVQGPKSGSQNYLSETNEIIMLPSASVLAELRQNSGRATRPGKTIAVFADPIFDADDPRLGKSSPGKSASGRTDMRFVLRDFNVGESLPRLLSSREEARNISAYAPKTRAVLNLDFDASRENVTGGSLADYRILHFATHALLDSTRPEFSGLVFSLYDKDGKAKDGFLRLDQIYNLNLDGDLVVLSACQTALGKDVRGEGLIGLTRGFMYAGARRVVASLWKVDDAATAEFMRRFYQNFLQKKLSAASALRQTQNEMKKVPRFRAPYFWAGFTMQGEWR